MTYDDKNDFILISDYHNNCIHIILLSPIYEEEPLIHTFSEFGDEDGELDNPLGIKIQDNIIWVVDAEFKMAELATIQVTTDQFVGRATEYLIIHIKDAIAKSEHCVLGLSGGSTPKDIYATLAKSTDFDWSKLYIFLVDDRYVPASHDQSNQKLIADSGLANKVLPEHYIFPNTNLELKECITNYDQKIKALFSTSPADIITLGLGDDGHIASLFPPVVEEGFQHDKMVIHTTTEKICYI